MVADAYRERESHDRSSIDLPPVQKQLAAEVIALGKPTVSSIQTSSVCTVIFHPVLLLLLSQVIFLLNGGSVAVETLIEHSNVAVIEAF